MGAAPRTLADLVFHIRDGLPARPDLLAIKRRGKVETWSTARFLGEIHAAALGLEGRGLRRGDRLAIYAENCPEWHALDFACQLLGVVSVPLYPTLPPAQVGGILRDAQATAIAYSDAEKYDVLSEARDLARPSLLIAIEDPARSSAPGVVVWHELIAEGEPRPGHFRAIAARTPIGCDPGVCARQDGASAPSRRPPESP